MERFCRVVQRIAAAALAVVCGDAACVEAQADGYKAEYALSTVVSESFPFGFAGKRWAELIVEKTQGRIVVRTYPGVSLVGGDQTKEFTALRQGIIDLAVGSTINWSPQVNELNLFSMPFLIPDHRAFDALIQGEVGTALFAALEAKDVIPLAWGENGFREISNSKRPISAPHDMVNLKIRVVASPLFVDTMTALGAKPVQLSWADLKPAVAAGVVDGQENPLAIFQAAKLHDSNQKYLTLWGYVADPLIFVVNRQVWESWSEGDRSLVREAAIQAAAEEIAMVRKGNDAHLRDIRAQGVTVTTLSPQQKTAFQQATCVVYTKWAKSIGTDLIAKAEAAVAQR
mgnify:CR=1 FL=1